MFAPTRGVYVHLPFCPYICPYCDFAKWPYRKSQAERYLRAVHAEIALAPPLPATTLFIGGGTPNVLEPEAIAGVVGAVRDRFALPADAEITLEANPDGRHDFDAYVAAGINRLSLGVQSFDAQERAALGRRHTNDDVARAVAEARAAGFASVSLDLIFGAPGTSLERWDATLAQALALAPDHLSAYGLTIEEGTPYAQWFASKPGDFANESLEADLFERTIKTLTAAGYEQYEISNFARPGHRSRHNANYWANGEYFGFGVGAASYLAGVRRTHAKDLDAYIAGVEAGAIPDLIVEELAGDERFGEAIMLALRTCEGVDAAVFAERYGRDPLDRYAAEIRALHEDGLLDADARGFRLTHRGRFLANDVAGRFLV